MISKKDEAAKETVVIKAAKKRRSSPSLAHTAAAKAEAVLAVWTDRVKIGEVMRQMGVTYMTVQQWQDRAMEGMLQALESRTNLSGGAVLSPRLQALLRKREMAAAALPGRFQARLDRASEVASEAAPASNG